MNLTKQILLLFYFLFEIFGILQGEPTKINSVQRIVSLAPSFTESICILGSKDSLIGCTTYCERPEEAKKIPKIGNTVSFNIEKIFSLKPDMVIASEFANTSLIKKLKNLGIQVTILKSPKNFQDLCIQFLNIAEILNKKKEGKQIIKKATKSITLIKNKYINSKKPTVFFQLGTNPIFAASKNSFISNMITLAGGKNIAEHKTSGIFSREKVLDINPDYMFITTMGILGEKEKLIWKKYPSLDAVKNDRINIVDSYIICSPTPLTYVDMVSLISYTIHES